MIFDEKFIIALAFFVCVGLIVKFSKKNFSKFLSNTKNAICKKISDVEESFDDLKFKIVKLKNEKITLVEKSKKDINEAENEKTFLIDEARKKSDHLFQNTIENQKIANERIKNESKKSLEKVSWNSAKQNLIQSLGEERVTDLHHNIINNILKDTLND